MHYDYYNYYCMKTHSTCCKEYILCSLTHAFWHCAGWQVHIDPVHFSTYMCFDTGHFNMCILKLCFLALCVLALCVFASVFLKGVLTLSVLALCVLTLCVLTLSVLALCVLAREFWHRVLIGTCVILITCFQRNSFRGTCLLHSIDSHGVRYMASFIGSD